MCLVQNDKNSQILTKSPTYSPWFFLKFETHTCKQFETTCNKDSNTLLNFHF